MKKKILTIIMATIMVMSIIISVPMVSADEPIRFKSDGLWYETMDDGNLKFSGADGSYQQSNCDQNNQYSVVVPQTVDGKNVTVIAESAFNEENMIVKGYNLKEIVLPEGLKVIEPYAFAGCLYLTQIEIPDTVEEIGEYAFYSTEALPGTILPKNLKKIETGVFLYSAIYAIDIPDTVENIGDVAFMGCVNLMKVKLPNSVKSLGFKSFAGCRSLSSFEFSDSVEEIGESCFDLCGYLKSITIPSSVKRLSNGYNMFSSCSALRTVVVDADVDCLPAGMFSGCSKLTDVQLNPNIKNIEERAFFCCSELKSINLPENLLSIGASAFCNCKNLTDIYIPASVNHIDKTSFANTDITIHGEKNTFAESFAKENAISFKDINEPEHILGDMDYDGIVSVSDVVALRHAIMIGDFNAAGDMDSNETLTVSDVVALRAAIMAG